MRTVGAARRGPDRQLAPAGADLEQPGAGSDPGRVEQPVDLAPLGLREQVGAATGSAAGPRRTAPTSRSWSRRGTARTGRWTGRSGGRCCAARPATCSAVVTAAGGARPAAQPLQPAPARASSTCAAKTAQQPGQVGGVPVAGHVRLAEPDEAGGAEPAEERRRVAQQHDRRAGPRVPRAGRRAARPAAAAGPPTRGNSGAGDGRAGARARRRGDVRPPVRVNGPAARRWSCVLVLVTEPPP